ncbi:MAG TPA: ribokinase [Acidimicrobiales bacterium]|nr:ribokinase [Acidimicrobiales bacterium]
MASKTVCVVGSFMMDVVVRTATRPAVGETVIGRSVDFFLGGKGFNQAVASARYGAPTAMVGRVGTDAFGDEFIDALARLGIHAEFVSRDRTVGTGVGVPIVDDTGANSIIVVPQANLECSPRHIEDAAEVIRNAAVVLAQLELPYDSVAEALRIARDAGVRTVLDPAPMGAESLARFRGLVDLVTPNESEAATIAPDAGDDPATIAAAVAAALDAPAVLLTLGERGALLWHDGHVVKFERHVVKVVDTVGAGDATSGALAAAWAGGASLGDAARVGNAAGALACTIAGAEPSMPHRVAIDQLLGGS